MRMFRDKIQLTPGQQKEKNKQLLLGLLSGVLLGLSYPPIPFPFLTFIAFIPFFYVLENRITLLSINRFTYSSLFFFSLITLYWVGSWTKEADPFLMISGVLLVILTPAFYMIVTTLYFLSRKVFTRRIALLLFPAYWVTFEHLYSITDLRFPWLTLGNALPYFKQFTQIVDVVGAYGLSLIVLYINVFLYLAIKEFYEKRKINYKFSSAAVLLLLLPVIYGCYKIVSYSEPQEKIEVGLIQPNFDPWAKWEAGSLKQQLDLYLQLSEKAAAKGAKIIIWPESALPVYLLGGNFDYEVERIHQFVSKRHIYLLTGMPDITFYFDSAKAPKDAKRTRISNTFYTSYNSILLFSPDNRNVQRYGKNILVPFGEHVPFVEQIPFLGDFIKWQVGISSWNVGREQNIFQLPDVKVGGIICIESIYPDFVTKFVNNGADFISVVTNDSWYGYSSGPFQHKEISVLRAIENRRSVVRAANGGVSCIIDPLGNITSKTGLFDKTILVGSVLINHEITFFTRFPMLIPSFAYFISLITLIGFITQRLKNKIQKKS
jgi:apolipoprotein N-acyltransferase